MTKKIIIAVVIVLLLAAAGIGYYLFTARKPATSMAPQEKQTAEKSAENPTNIADMIQKAMTSGTSLKCTYTTANVTVTSYIKNGMVGSSTVDSATNKTIHAIIRDKTMWTWNEGETKGTMLNMSQIEANASPEALQSQQAVNPEDIKNRIAANKPNCTQEALDDSIFTPPSNVTFTDLSKMMKAIPQVTLPAGVKIPTGVPAQ